MDVIQTGTNIATVKISELPETKDLNGKAFVTSSVSSNESNSAFLDTIIQGAAEAIETRNRFSVATMHGQYWGSSGNVVIGTAHTGTMKFNVIHGRRYKIVGTTLTLVSQFSGDEYRGTLIKNDIAFSEFIAGDGIDNVGIDVTYDANADYVYVMDITDLFRITHDQNLSEFYLRLLPYGQYIGSSGQIVNASSNPAWRGTQRIAVSDGQYFDVGIDPKYYLLYDADGTAVTRLKAVPANGIIQIPAGAAYMVFNCLPDIEVDDILIRNVTETQSIQSQIGDLKAGQWQGKQWYAFGTSISDTSEWSGHDAPSGQYPPFLVKISGLVHNNWAVKGSMLANGADDPDRNSILKQISIAAGLEADESGKTENHLAKADLITIEGLVNDWAHSTNLAPMGTLDDMQDDAATDGTIYGALYLAIKYCYQANPNARVVLITDNTGKADRLAFYKKNGLGLFQSDYAKAMTDAAQHMGCICIDAGNRSQINIFHPDYMIDDIHQSEKGGEQFAMTIWSELKNVYPAISGQ